MQILKIAVPLGVIAWLLGTIDPGQAAELRNRPKHWGLLAAAFLIALTAISLTFLRWYFLVRVVALNLTLRDAFRLSFAGYLASFVSAGNVGGDLLKAVFIAREQPQRRTAAVATVVVDRILGLYALLVVASLALLISNAASHSPALHAISQVTFAATAVGGISVLLLLVPGFTQGRATRWLSRIPRIGPVCLNTIDAVRQYHHQRGVIAGILVMSVLVHILLSGSVYLLAQGLFGSAPGLADHLVIVPLSCVAGAIPLTPGGLGSFEVAMDELYRWVPAASAPLVSGLLIALAYRLATILIAGLGVFVFCHRGRSSFPLADE